LTKFCLQEDIVCFVYICLSAFALCFVFSLTQTTWPGLGREVVCNWFLPPPPPESRPLVCLAFKQIVREQASKRTRYSVDMTMNGYGKMVKIRIASPMDCIIFCQHRFEPNWCVSFLN
jgi:hypothetical protein